MMLQELEQIRKQYTLASLDEVSAVENPYKQFARWFEEALQAEVLEPNAMTLATATADGSPSARVVLLKGFDEHGFRFYTNYESRKGDELKENPRVALVFFWPELERQVRIEGLVDRLAAEDSMHYFQSRPKGSQIGAWASPQSHVVASREALETRFSEVSAHYDEEEFLPLPPYWGGYVVKPFRFEFWQGRHSRLHDRLRYTLTELQPEVKWTMERLAP